MAEDALSDLLRTVRLTGAAFFDVAASDQWAIESPSREQILPKVLPGANHLVAYHVVTAGHCFASPKGGTPVALETGQVVVFTDARSHVMSSHPGLPGIPTSANAIEIATAGELPFCINCGGDGPVSTRLVCGYLACDVGPFNPLFDHLPTVITAGRSGREVGWLEQFVRYAVQEASQKRTGHEIILTKLSELMFIDVLREYIEALPPQERGWLAGLRDPFIGKALSLIHAKPAHAWTLDELAKLIGQSRSVLAERFADLVGIPPIHYLSKWRMQIAAELLKRGTKSLSEIAAEVGYESDSAFSRAFKKTTGVAPSAWRRGSTLSGSPEGGNSLQNS
jgi:AraC-like DNA-binding protein